MATKTTRKPATTRPAAKPMSNPPATKKAPAKPAKPARLAPDTKITIIAKEVPTLRGSRAERWALVKSGMTVAQLAEKLKAGGYSVTAGAMANWMAEAGLVKLG